MEQNNKFCPNRGCKFYENSANGAPNYFDKCYSCAKPLVSHKPSEHSEGNNSIKDQSGPKISEEKCAKNPWNPISKSQKSDVKTDVAIITFLTAILKSDYNKVKGNISLKFAHSQYGDFKFECLNSFASEIKRYEGRDYILLDNSIKIGSKILSCIEKSEYSLFIPYKYYLGEDGENLYLPQGDCFRTLIIGNSNFSGSNAVMKYDMIILPDGTDKECDFRDPATRLELLFNLYIPSVEDSVYLSFHDIGYKIQDVLFPLCYGYYSAKRFFKANKNFLLYDSMKKMHELTSKLLGNWLMKVINNYSISYHSKFFLLFVTFEKELVQSFSNELFYLLLQKMNLQYFLTLLQDQSRLKNEFLEYQSNIISSPLILHDAMKHIAEQEIELLINFLPLYHIIFDSQTEYEIAYNKHEFENNEFWGLPSDTEFQCNNKIEISIIHNAIENFCIVDPLLANSIILLSMSDDSFPQLLELFPTHLLSFMCVLLYRVKKWPCFIEQDYKLRESVFMKFLDKSEQIEHLSMNEEDICQACDVIFKMLAVINDEDETQYCIHLEESKLILRVLAKLLSLFDEKCPQLLSEEYFHLAYAKIFHLKSASALLNILRGCLNPDVLASNYKSDFVKEVSNIWDYLYKIQFPQPYKFLFAVDQLFTRKLEVQDLRSILTTLVDICSITYSQDSHSDSLNYSLCNEVISILDQTQTPEQECELCVRCLVEVPIEHFNMIVEVFAKLLACISKLIKSDPIKHILSTTWWPKLINYCQPKHFEKYCHHDAASLIESVIHTVESLATSLQDQSIKTKYFRLAIKHNDNCFSLLQLVSKSHHEFTDLATFEECLFCIDKNLHNFLHYHALMYDLKKLLDYTKTQMNSQILSDFLTIEFEDMSISSLCHNSVILPRSKHKDFLNNVEFVLMLESLPYLRQSQFFMTTFSNTFQDCFKDNQFEFFELEIILDKVWYKSSIFVSQIIRDLLFMNILLSDIDNHFGIYRRDSDKMGSEISNLLRGINTGASNDHDKEEDRSEILAKIKHHFKLVQVRNIAEKILEVKDAYSMNGDFSTIKFINELNLEGKRLKDISKEMVKIGTKLSHCDDLHFEILRQMIVCINLFHWIIENLKNQRQLDNFTDLALNQSNNSTFEVNRITCFKDVCRIFAPLIFERRNETDQESFLLMLNAVHNNLKSSEQDKCTILEMSEDCAKEIYFDFWKQLLLNHTSIGGNIISKLKEILSKGVFIVKLEEDLKNIEDVMSIHVSESKFYSLHELKEMQSEVVLITSERHDDKIGTQFQNILRILMEFSEIVLKLYLSGNVFFRKTKENLSYGCHSIQIIEEDTAFLEKEYDSWINNLEKARDKHYYLNYFTSSQIIAIQMSLDSYFKNIEFDQEFFHLLSLIKENLTIEDVKTVIKRLNEGSRSITNSLMNISSNISLESPLIRQISEEDLLDPILTPIDNPFGDNSKFEQNDTNTFDAPFQEEITSLDSDEGAKSDLRKNYEKETKANLNSLDTLEKIFEKLSSYSKHQARRDFLVTFKEAEPNLLFVTSSNILKCLLSIYIPFNSDFELPQTHEILLCSEETALEEVEIFLRRALKYRFSNIFCIAFIEKLSYEVAVDSVSLFKKYVYTLSQNSNYRLVFICSDECKASSYMATAFARYTRITPSDKHIDKKLVFKIISQSSDETTSKRQAWQVDPDTCYIRIVTSKSSGNGKSLTVLRQVEKLKSFFQSPEISSLYTTITIHEGEGFEDKVVQTCIKSQLLASDYGRIYHFDLISDSDKLLIPFLFKLLVTRTLCDYSGNIWRCSKNNYYMIEINLKSRSPELVDFLHIFPTWDCLSPNETINVEEKTILLECQMTKFDQLESESDIYRRTHDYLSKLKSGSNMDKYKFNSENSPKINLKLLLEYLELETPSWSELKHFLTFMNHQLVACENNIYCQSVDLDSNWRGFKKFVIDCLILMTLDFTTPSLRISLQSSIPSDEPSGYSIDSERKWEKKKNPYIFFNEDLQSMTFFGISIDKNLNQLNVFDSNPQKEKKVIRKPLYNVLENNKVDLGEDCNNWGRSKMIEVLANVLGIQSPIDPDPHYVLTIDNLKKMFAIQMRFRSNIPVILMGETGCGKTRLIKFMCQLQDKGRNIKNVITFKIHGEIYKADIMHYYQKALKLAKENASKNIDTILFFDEVNTSYSIGLIKEILCDRRIDGVRIPNDLRLQFVAACNPYRKHTEEMLSKLTSAGLGMFNTSDKVREHFGNIPLRELVYRVLPLSDSLLPLVWDFGTLDPESERSYILGIVDTHLPHDKSSSHLNKAIATVLLSAQKFMRDKDDECSFVSLRDVERTLKVMLWFQELLPKIDNKLKFMKSIDTELNLDTRSLILSIAVCYRAKLLNREDFDKDISCKFNTPLDKVTNASLIFKEIKAFQDVLVSLMTIGEHIAKNKALKENLFMMFVCIQLKIPLFIIGKPGTSKSLAKHIISHSLNGDFNLDGNKIAQYTQIYMRSYQCSQLTTSKEIQNLFESCQTIQEESAADCVACVVLDEVGLAEDSPSLPLKILHPLLEDGINETNEQIPNTAFIGLSNWALDPAKMNRGIMLRLEDPTLEDIVDTGQSIIKSSEKEDINSLRKLIPNIPNLSKGYLKLIEKQQKKGLKDYFGLRDLYHLIKMLNQLCKEYETFNSRIFNHAILRNFGGITKINVIEIFEDFPLDLECTETGPHSDILSLIRSSLLGKSKWNLPEEEREKQRIERSRYLLLLTENYVALDILFHSEILKNDAKVIFGSSFPLDQEYFGICHTINRIKVFMETGKVVVLTNLSNVYESLYELLNLFYVDILGKSWVDIGIGSQRIKCPVHPDFRLIVIADRNTVFDRFPPPLINRLEKHNLTFSTILEEDIIVKNIIDTLSKWVQDFVTINDNKSSYSPDKCFIGIQNDTPSFMVYSSIRILGLKGKEKESMGKILNYCKLELLKIASPDAILRIRKSQLAEEADKIYGDYCTLKLFDLVSYLEELPNIRGFHNQSTPYLSYITTYSTLLTEFDIEKLRTKLNVLLNSEVKITFRNLSQFKSEREFISAIKEDIQIIANHESKGIIIIQCENGQANFDLVSCAKYKVMEIINEMSAKLNSNYHFVFITRLLFHQGLSKHSSFCGGDWDSVYIDELQDSSHNLLPPFDELANNSVVEVFNYQHSKTVESIRSTDKYRFQKRRLIRCIQKAVCELHGRNADRINYIVNLLANPQFTEIADLTCKIVSNLLKSSNSRYSREWSRIAALESDYSTVSTTFAKALSLHIDDLITPLFSDILAIIDTNDNLNLIFPKHQCTKLAWEHIYHDENILHWESLINNISLKFQNNSKKGLLVKNQFPFFTLIYQQVDRLFNEMNTNIGTKETCKIFEDNFNQSPIGKMMSFVQKESKKTFSLNADYLRDFLLLHMMESKEEMQQYRCLFILMSVAASKHRGTNNQDLIVPEDFSQKLPDYNIPSIHIAYSFVKERVFFINEAFNNGFKFCKGHPILSDKCLSIPSNYSQLQNIDFEIFKDLVDTCWEDISKLQVNDPKWFIERFTRYSCLIEENWTLFKSFSKEIDLLRNKWERIQCVHLFITHFLTESAFKEISSKTNIQIKSISIFETAFNDISKISPQDVNFHSSESIKSILAIINSMYKGILSLKLEELNHKCETSKEGFSCLGCLFELEFQNQAVQFFLQIILKITFTSATELHEDLLHYFIEFIFNDQTFNMRKGPMNKLYLFDKIEPSSSLRCMLLQHLLRHSWSESINNQIENRIAIICPDLKEEIQAESLIFIVLQSWEDYHHYQCKVSENDTRINYVLSQLTNTDLLKPFSSKDVTYELIKSVAIIKFAIYWIVKWKVDCFLFDEYINSQRFSFRSKENHQRSVKVSNLGLLINEFVSIIQTTKIPNILNTIQTFLLKALYFHVGYGALLNYQNDPKMEYFFPKVSTTSGDGSKGTYLDLFYGIDPSYLKALQIRKKDQKSKIGEKAMTRNIIFSIFTKCNSNRISNKNGLTQKEKHKKNSTDELKKELTQLTNSLPKQPINLQSLAADILDNKPFNMQEMSISEDTHLNTVFIAGVLCHVGILLQYTEHSKFLQPLTQIHYNPSSLKNNFFPTIEEISNSTSSGSNIYSSTKSKDSESFHASRTVSHKPHVLGDPFGRPRRPSSIRDLTAISVALIRVLMHSIFIWTLHTKHFISPGTVGQLVEFIDQNTYSQYFYLHLVQDIIDVATISNKTFEEAVLLVHLLFDTIVNEKSSPCTSDSLNELTNVSKRQSWEVSFQEFYIVKLEKYIDIELREKMMAIISNSNNCDSDLLLDFYEKEEKRDFQSILWRHRHIIGYEHLLQRFNCQTENPSKKYPLLRKFLKEESLLKATRYLPDYVRLRTELIQKSLEYSSKVKISELTIGEFQELIEKEDGNSYDEFKDLFTSLMIDWKEFRRDIYDSEYYLPPRYINYEIDYKTTKTRHLIGTSCRSDEGLLMSLIKVLVKIHNSFIREYTKAFAAPSSSKRRVSLSLVSPSHIIKYKHQLDNVILSNATYSFRMGEGTLIHYDFNGIQNELGQRFIFSKPFISLDDFDTEFHDQVPIIKYFHQINLKIKQIELLDMDWNAIKEELDKPAEISDVISLIEMVVKLTLKDELNPDERIAAYLIEYLKYPKTKNLISKKANEVCCLKHLSSLWHKLNIHKSKIFVNIGQSPFPSLSSNYLKNPKSGIKELMGDLTTTELDEFLVILHDFVMFNLILSHGEVDLACSLRESLIKFSKEVTIFSAYRKEFEYEKISTNFAVSEAVKIWTSLVSECKQNTSILSMI